MVRVYALLGVLLFIGLMWLYTQEFVHFSNTIGIKSLLIGSFTVGLVLACSILWWMRERLTPLAKHYPEVLFIVVITLLFSPLFGSLLNRLGGKKVLSEFKFISERAFLASGYGILEKGHGLFENEGVKPNQWILTVQDNGVIRRFRYKSQAYYPITQPGELISLPVVHGLFGVWVVELK
jgi:hypothetical protein